MIVIDANLLIYAYNEQMQYHSASRRWLEETLSSDVEVGIPVQAVLAFIRLSTSRKLHGPHSSLLTALGVVDSWLTRASVQILHPGQRHWEIFRRISAEAGASGNLSTDAHIAALAIEYDALLYSADTDFARFPGLHWKNPVAGK